jgi:hypothetical protein
MPEQFVCGTKWWCIRPSIEAEGYGDNKPRHPWQGILSIEKRPGGTVYELSAFDPETDRPDKDSNATTIITNAKEQLFGTLREARFAYMRALTRYLEELTDEIADVLVDLGMLQRELEE